MASSESYLQHGLEERLQFEQLMSSFVNISPKETENQINKCLQQITDFFAADRCTLGLF